ncbi:uncharacterized protein LOC122507487 [Leptopilina heterotoma]|uniref:uncharacterized protein LOC122507487 n=1 Tax=Leptopilina heterotoma TaxID=63436 RepID=UPI001CAA1F2E|nr:uncharacterized protein LOC122507487 [Leptopilina heterotoma]XP_043476158.1 uncharacterized protein LOC122507487 [Leptopilina heterotoma]
MKSSKMERFLPNECYICKSRDNLKRCECNMISYCSEDHRLKHSPVHESFCKVIKELLKEKKVAHIYEELTNVGGSLWTMKQDEIYQEIEKKLERNFSPLENFMFDRPRNCFDCSNTQHEDLNNCPHCALASFCKNHSQDKLHSINCKVMNQYLKILNAAEEFNIDLEFLSPTFPCITEEKVNQVMDSLTLTYHTMDMEENCLKSRLLKKDLINFMDVASKINRASQKLYETITEELIIHIDALSYEHAITKENYWEFLLHLNPQMKKLKILITATKNLDNLETSLCQNCHLEEKELIVEYSSKTYDDYMLDENYQKPDILFYVQINDECNSERFDKWSELNCPIILRFDSKLNFFKVHHLLSLLIAKFRFIHKGQLKPPFSTLSSIENKDYFIILQSKGNKVLQKSCDTATGEINGENIGTTTTEILVDRNKSKELNEERKSVDRVTISPSSSKRSFAAIDERGEEEAGKKNKKSKTENSNNCSKSNDKENFDPNGEERKIVKKNDKINSSQSYLIERNSFLENENKDLRKQLNLSLNEVTNLQTKLDHVSFNLNKKEKVIKKLLLVIVDYEDIKIKDTDSLCEKNI